MIDIEIFTFIICQTRISYLLFHHHCCKYSPQRQNVKELHLSVELINKIIVIIFFQLTIYFVHLERCIESKGTALQISIKDGMFVIGANQ